MSVYNVSKHAVVTLSETLFHDLRLAKAKMGVSVLCPAYVPTNIRNVITHAKMLASVELRFQDLLAQRNPSDPYTIKPEVAVRPRETRARRSLLEETQLSPAAGWRAGSPPVPGGAGRCRA